MERNFFSFGLGFEREKRLSLDKGGNFFENIQLSGPILWKKKHVFLFYIYNFYFENLIYKWIKQFEYQ